MSTRRNASYEGLFSLSVLLLFGLISSCAPPLSSLAPPENYKGPIAERPTLAPGDYWVYERADGRRVKAAPATSLANLGFPLWVGKTWSYQSGSLLLGQAPISKAFRTPVMIECTATAFEQVAVTAGSLGAFECQCQCTTLQANYEPDCGTWTIWYAPQVKNIIKIKTQSTTSTMQLVEYKVSHLTPSKQVAQEKVLQKVEQEPAQAKPVSQAGLKAEKPEWKVGYEWRYAWKRPGRSGTYTNEVIREDLFEGVPSYVVRSGTNENYYARNVLGIFARMSGGKVIFKRDKPRQNLSWPLEVGKEWRNSYLRENIQEKSSQTFDYRMVVAKIEEVKVPAGTFEAIKVEVYVYHSGNLFAEYWYSPKVKWLVKEREYLQDGPRETELMSFKVD